MRPRQPLSAVERRFFSLVAEAAFANPFSDERLELDSQILGQPARASRGERVPLLQDKVGQELARLTKSSRENLAAYEGNDREILRIAHLFEVYHRFSDDFDRLILEQVAAGDTLCAAPFAASALAEMERRGFGAEEAERFFALFFQLRRAYYFIDRRLKGRSPCMKELRRHLWESVFTHDIRLYERHLLERMEDFSTLLLGETGAGKGSAAFAIGCSGFIPFDRRRGRFAESFTRAFLAVNLSQFPEQLIESELFGHRKGAFTGAVEDHAGVFARCSPYGSIFLDEVGDASGPVQIKLLQVLQERVFSPVGGHERVRFQGRVIAATNRRIEERLARGALRDDFLYRISSDIITVPPLRQRLREDPAELDELLAETLAKLTGRADPELAAELRRRLDECLPAGYEWPGNVRELEQCARRLLLTRHYTPLQRETANEEGDLGRLFRSIRAGTLSARGLLGAYCAHLRRRLGTVAEVARRVGLDRRTVRRCIEEAEEAEAGEAAPGVER